MLICIYDQNNCHQQQPTSADVDDMYVISSIIHNRLATIDNGGKNNKGETILDKSINNNYIYTTAKILSDRRFNNINMVSFKNLYDTYIKSNNYGKYSKIDNLTLIVNNLQRKDLNDSLALLIRLFRRNRKVIYEEITNSDTSRMDFLIDYVVKEMI